MVLVIVYVSNIYIYMHLLIS